MTPAQARADLAAALADVPDVQVFDRLPDRWTPPALVLDPAEPWIVTTDPEVPWRSGVFRFVVQVVGQHGTPEAGPSRVEDVLTDVLAALYASPSEWSVETVGKPGTLVVEGLGAFPCVEVTVSAPLSLS